MDCPSMTLRDVTDIAALLISHDRGGSNLSPHLSRENICTRFVLFVKQDFCGILSFGTGPSAG
jgi:hypothetical protein